jgi:hypothetical protein
VEGLASMDPIHKIWEDLAQITSAQACRGHRAVILSGSSMMMTTGVEVQQA